LDINTAIIISNKFLKLWILRLLRFWWFFFFWINLVLITLKLELI
jgi:hypothetical protein